MLLWLLQHLAAASSLAGLGKITARASLAALVSFLLAVILGPRSIAWLACRFREPIKSDSPEICRLHQSKKATPTMGGLFMIAGLAGSLLLAGDLSNRYLLLALGVAGGLTLLGVIDDLVKLRSESAAFPPPASCSASYWWRPWRPGACMSITPRCPTACSCLRR